MAVREIIKIDEDKCTGCGDCIPNCPEGALQIIDGKARMLSDIFCDGLGACIGYCPEGAITTEKREAEEYDEYKVMVNVVKQGPNVIKAHLEHMKDHNQTEFLNQAIDYLKTNNIDIPEGFDKEPEEDTMACGCPSNQTKTIEVGCTDNSGSRNTSQLGNWPVQIHLMNAQAQYLKNASLLIAADCTAFASANLHQDYIKGKVTMICCPKLDDTAPYLQKLTELFKLNNTKDITVVIMEVPCCSGLVRLVKEAIQNSGLEIPLDVKVIGTNGELIG